MIHFDGKSILLSILIIICLLGDPTLYEGRCFILWCLILQSIRRRCVKTIFTLRYSVNVEWIFLHVGPCAKYWGESGV